MNSEWSGTRGVKSPAPIEAVSVYGSDKLGVGVCNRLRASELWWGGYAMRGAMPTGSHTQTSIAPYSGD